MVAIADAMAVSTLARGQTGVRKDALRRTSRVVRVEEPDRDCDGMVPAPMRRMRSGETDGAWPSSVNGASWRHLRGGVPKRACALWNATFSLFCPSSAVLLV